MGLIKAGIGALGSTFADQWKEFFYCDSIPEDTLVVKGQKRITSRSSNTKGSDNIISNGSGIAVADGQCMIIVDQGKIVEVCAEPGEFTYDSSSEPSLFAGSLGKSIIDSFKTFGRRFAYGGDTGKDQRVYYFNTKEITDNKFGTPTPVPFRIVINEELGFKMSVDLRCNGIYSYKLVDPILFYKNVSGNVESAYKRDKIDSMLKGELMTELQPALAVLSANGISYDQIPAHADDLADALNNELKDKWGKRGIEIFSMNIGVPSIPEDQRKKLLEWEEAAMTTNPTVAAARMTAGQIEAMKTAAGNQGGAMMGFMGMNMAQMSGGMNASQLYQMGQQTPAQQPTAPAPAPANGWTCQCGNVCTDAFCPKCGSKKPEQPAGGFCSKCGSPVDADAMFCSKCGNKLK